MTLNNFDSKVSSMKKTLRTLSIRIVSFLYVALSIMLNARAHLRNARAHSVAVTGSVL